MKKETHNKGFTKKDAAKALCGLLSDHDRIYGDYTLGEEVDEYDEEQINEWKAERRALVMAINCLRR